MGSRSNDDLDNTPDELMRYALSSYLQAFDTNGSRLIVTINLTTGIFCRLHGLCLVGGGKIRWAVMVRRCFVFSEHFGALQDDRAVFPWPRNSDETSWIDCRESFVGGGWTKFEKVETEDYEHPDGVHSVVLTCTLKRHISGEHSIYFAKLEHTYLMDTRSKR